MSTIEHGPDDPEFGPELVTDLAGVFAVEEIRRDRERAFYVYEAIRETGEGPFLATPDGEVFVYDDGVWRGDPHGEQALRELGLRGLGQFYGANVLDELKEQVRASDVVSRERLGVPGRTVAVANGLLDVETRELRNLRPDDHALNRLPVGFNPEADYPRWERFIGESVEAERIEAVQEFVGYCLLVGELPLARVLLLVGGGSNGKTTFLNVVQELLGSENVTGFSLSKLTRNEYYVAKMFGAVANIDADVGDKITHVETFKKLTGGDRKMSARHPYGEPFDFRPTTKHLYAANEVPDVSDDTEAFFRRWLIAEFPTTFTDPDQPGPDIDPDLEVALLGELPGILNWALDGLDRLLAQGHFTNEGTTDGKRDRWQSWGDSVERFISECVTAEGETKHRTGEVYERYKAWCAQHDVTAESQQTLTQTIKKLDGVRYSSTFRFDGKQGRGFKGLMFTAEAPPPTDDEAVGVDTTLDQATAKYRVVETVRELVEANDGEAVPREDVLDALREVVGERNPERLVADGVERGVFYEPEDGRIRPA